MNKIAIPIMGAGIVLSLFSVLNLAGSNPQYASGQLGYLFFGWVVFFFTIWKGYELFRLNSILFFGLFSILLILTYFFGENVRGSTRWIQIFGINIQSSEFIKIGFIGLIGNLYSYSNYLSFRLFLKGCCLAFITGVLILRQPDLGNSIVVIGIFLFMSYYAGLSLKKIFAIVLLAVIIAPLFWLRMAEFQRARIISFMNPESYSQTIGYNMIQSVITTGSGGFFGKGLGRGTQAKNKFLPESHTDFAFASLTEQFGFMGGGLVIGSYMTIVVMSLISLFRQRERFSYLVISGITGYFFIHSLINIGMNMGLLPVTGIVLPLISYGGSSVLTTMILLGLLSANIKSS